MEQDVDLNQDDLYILSDPAALMVDLYNTSVLITYF